MPAALEASKRTKDRATVQVLMPPHDSEEAYPGSVTAEVTTITPEVADRMLAEFRYGGQRQLRMWWVRELAHELELGRLAPCAIDVGHIIGSGEPGLLLNGQHRLTAICTVRKSATMIVIHHFLSSQKEVEQLYRRIDRGKTRPLADTVGPELSASTQLSRGHIRLAGAACKLIAGDFKPQFQALTRSLDDQVAAVEEWGEIIRIYLDLLNGAQKPLDKRMFRSAVMGVALVTLRHQTDKAREFWRHVALNDGLRAGSPAQTLVNSLIGPGSESWRCTAPEQARKVAACWNAFYEGRDMARVKPASISVPITILGTPYKNPTKA